MYTSMAHVRLRYFGDRWLLMAPVCLPVTACGGGNGSATNTSSSSSDPVPAITSLSPSWATAGAAAPTLTINGTNLLSPSTVTWAGGSDTAGRLGVYGTQGVPVATNAPGARLATVSRTDSNGNLRPLGGGGVDSTGEVGLLNDLWRFLPVTSTSSPVHPSAGLAADTHTVDAGSSPASGSRFETTLPVSASVTSSAGIGPQSSFVATRLPFTQLDNYNETKSAPINRNTSDVQ